ncbi:hypothetical protein FOZ61_005021 [Perkinsus olseni]|uniref:Uncharacterized protein n=1 Tax=Perkinsus olseni TaxID=32597 RepID=A0A7J6M507_PEROL|nr:hypothetical protein FOZ61_005021 [Perkinsus olseni]KAF4666240.1 hypothetical protein FOL46_003191 [Perkinsus olseni]
MAVRWPRFDRQGGTSRVDEVCTSLNHSTPYKEREQFTVKFIPIKMSPAKSIIITTAAAMVVNLAPLGEAIEAAASVNPLHLEEVTRFSEQSLLHSEGDFL